jgi:hypothetical protein
MSDKIKLIPESDAFVEYMHKTYPGLEGLPYRTAMLQAHDFLVGNYHEREKERKRIGDKIQKLIDKGK